MNLSQFELRGCMTSELWSKQATMVEKMAPQAKLITFSSSIYSSTLKMSRQLPIHNIAGVCDANMLAITKGVRVRLRGCQSLGN
jgi:alpha-galactosidase/6-phospho-beta-glucosidase family protein